MQQPMKSHIIIKSNKNNNNISQSSYSLVPTSNRRRPKIFDLEDQNNILPSDLLDPLQQQNNEPEDERNMFNFFRQSFQPVDTVSPVPAFARRQSSQNQKYYQLNPPKNQEKYFNDSVSARGIAKQNLKNNNIQTRRTSYNKKQIFEDLSEIRQSGVTEQTQKMNWNRTINKNNKSNTNNNRSGNNQMVSPAQSNVTSSLASGIKFSYQNKNKNVQKTPNFQNKSSSPKAARRALTQQQMLRIQLQKQRDMGYVRPKTIFINEGGIHYDRRYQKQLQRERQLIEKEQMRDFKSFQQMPNNALNKNNASSNQMSNNYDSVMNENNNSLFQGFNINNINQQNGQINEGASLTRQMKQMRDLENHMRRNINVSGSGDSILSSINGSSKSFDSEMEKKQKSPRYQFNKGNNGQNNRNPNAFNIARTQSVEGYYFGDQKDSMKFGEGIQPIDDGKDKKVNPFQGLLKGNKEKPDILLTTLGMKKFAQKPKKKAPFQIKPYIPTIKQESHQSPIKQQKFEQPIKPQMFPYSSIRIEKPVAEQKQKIKKTQNLNGSKSIIHQVSDDALQRQQMNFWANNMMQTIRLEKEAEQKEGVQKLTDKELNLIKQTTKNLVPSLNNAPKQETNILEEIFKNKNSIRSNITTPNAANNQQSGLRVSPVLKKTESQAQNNEKMLKSKTNRMTVESNLPSNGTIKQQKDSQHANFNFGKKHSRYTQTNRRQSIDYFLDQQPNNEGKNLTQQSGQQFQRKPHNNHNPMIRTAYKQRQHERQSQQRQRQMSQRSHHHHKTQNNDSSGNLHGQNKNLGQIPDVIPNKRIKTYVQGKKSKVSLNPNHREHSVDRGHSAISIKGNKSQRSNGKLHSKLEHLPKPVSPAKNLGHQHFMGSLQGYNTRNNPENKSQRAKTEQSDQLGDKLIISKFKLINMTLYMNILKALEYHPLAESKANQKNQKSFRSRLGRKIFGDNDKQGTVTSEQRKQKAQNNEKQWNNFTLNTDKFLNFKTPSLNNLPTQQLSTENPNLNHSPAISLELQHIHQQLLVISQQLRHELPTIRDQINQNQQKIQDLQQFIYSGQHQQSSQRKYYRTLKKMKLQQVQLLQKQKQIYQKEQNIKKYQNQLIQIRQNLRQQDQQMQYLQKQIYYENRLDNIKRYNEVLCGQLMRQKQKQRYQQVQIQSRQKIIKKNNYIYQQQKDHREKDNIHQHHHQQQQHQHQQAPKPIKDIFEQYDQEEDGDEDQDDEYQNQDYKYEYEQVYDRYQKQHNNKFKPQNQHQHLHQEPIINYEYKPIFQKPPHPIDQLEEIDHNLQMLRQFRKNKKSQKASMKMHNQSQTQVSSQFNHFKQQDRYNTIY